METKRNKLLPMLSALCLGVTSLCADMSNSATANNVAVPPSPTPGETGPNVFISADYTLWTARETGLAVAVSNFYGDGTPEGDAVQGKVYYPKMKLRSGFKVDLGVYLPHDNWDLKAEYTWFNNNNNSLHAANFTSGLARSNFNNADYTGEVLLDSLSSSWNLWFNRIDLTMGRSFFAGHYLSVRPFMGLLGAWDNQRQHVNFVTTGSVDVWDGHNNQKSWGVGAYGGMNATFTFVSDSSNQWSLFLDAGTALPWAKTQGTQYLNNSTTDVTLYSFKNTNYLVSSMLETALGIRWETWWSDGSWMFLLQAAWEEQVWFNHNNMSNYADNGSNSGNGTFTLQGLTVKAALAF